MMKNICLGDSLTASYHVRPEEGWVTLLGRETPDTWINAGVSGDTSAGMLARLLTEVFPQKPDRVLYMGGDNDILVTGSLDQAKSSLMSILHLCVDREIRPVIGIPIPILDIPQPWQAICDPQKAQALSRQYIHWLREFTAALSLRRVDFASAFCAAPELRVLYLPDGMHPSPLGHRLMADTVIHTMYR